MLAVRLRYHREIGARRLRRRHVKTERWPPCLRGLPSGARPGYPLRVLLALRQQLDERSPLTTAQVSAAVAALVDEMTSPEVKAEFLTALARKGETTEEIVAFATELRLRSLQPKLDRETREREILDVCGTGGDQLNTFNISTTVALIAASANITVAKHGNRAITSQSGSADVLEALGVAIDLTPDQAAQWLRDHHFAFFFAQKYHPAFKQIGPARKLCAQRQQRTIFNFLGPLLNPARPSAQLVGVPRPELCQPLATVLQKLGVRRAMVVSGRIDGQEKTFLDEISTLGETMIAEFYHDRALATSSLNVTQFSLQPTTLQALAGGDRMANARIVREILDGADRGSKRDAVLLNAAAALFVAGTTKSMIDGWVRAEELIDSGRARSKLDELVAASQALPKQSS